MIKIKKRRRGRSRKQTFTISIVRNPRILTRHFAESLARFILYIGIFLLPLTFSSAFSHPSIFPKYLVLLFIAVLVSFLSVIYINFSRKRTSPQSILHTIVILFLFGYILSAIFSSNPLSSLIGIHGSWIFSVIGIAGFCLIFFISSNLFSSKHSSSTLLWVITLSGFLISTIIIFNWLIFDQYSNELLDNLTLLPQSNSLSLLLIISSITSTALLLFYKDKPLKIALGAIILTIGFSLSLAGNALVIIISVAIALICMVPLLKEKRLRIGTIAGAIVLFATGLIILSRTYTIDADLFKYYFLQIETGFRVFGQRPLVGTGPEMFYTQYRNYIPEWVLNTHLWNQDVLQIPSLYVHIIATAGLAGFLPLFALLIANIVQYVKNVRTLTVITWGFGASSIVWLVTHLAIIPDTTSLFIGAILLGTTARLWIKPRSHSNKNSRRSSRSILIINTFISCIFLIAIIRFGTSEYNYTQTFNNSSGDSVEYSTAATEGNSFEPVYQRAYATELTSFLIEDPYNENSREILRQIHKTYERAISLNNDDADNFRNAAENLHSIGIIYTDDLYLFSALSHTSKAITLSPYDPSLYLLQGQILLDTGNSEAALRNFEKSIELKNNYWVGYLYAAEAAVQKNDTDLAVSYLTHVTENASDQFHTSYARGKLEALGNR